MDLFNSIAGGKKTPTSDNAGDDKPSEDLMSDAKLVAAAAQSAANKDYEKIDKGRVAGAGSDLLGAAKDYGKLGDEGTGKYVGQAHDYLHQYSLSNTSPTKDTKPESGKEEEKPAETPAAVPEAGEGVGKAAEKPESGKEEEKSTGDYLKMAQGFLGK